MFCFYRVEVSVFVAGVIQEWKSVKRVFTGDQLYNAAIDDEWMDMVRKGYHHAESGDVILAIALTPEIVKQRKPDFWISHSYEFARDNLLKSYIDHYYELYSDKLLKVKATRICNSQGIY